MRRVNTILIKMIMIIGFSITALDARDVGVLVVSNDVTVENISRDELSSIFLGKISNWENGNRINIGYSINVEEKVNTFFDEIIGQNHRRFKKYWLKKVFAGYGVAPRMFKTSQKALEFVKSHEGCILFVTVGDIKEIESFKQVAVDGLLEF